MKKNIYLLSLGCARNLVDSEIILGILKDNNFNITFTIESADIAILNTCVFIEETKQESIDVLLNLVQLKREKKLKKIIVVGCMPCRYPESLKKEIPEIDGLVGFDKYPEIHKAVEKVLLDKKVFWVTKHPKFIYDDKLPRVRLTPTHYAYVKISEGCSHKCTFCIISSIKGRYRSRPIESILREVKRLIEFGVREIILIGQDTTAYGIDAYKKPILSELLIEVAQIVDLKWLRLLYAHPSYFNDEVISCFEKFDNICKYVDIPLQHINDKILKAMGRPSTRMSVFRLIKNIRKRLPDVAIRTSLIVGFPKESVECFQELVDFIKEVKFERLGLFKYSREESTIAYNYSGQIPDKEKENRFCKIMSIQRDISRQINSKFLNKKMKVMIDEKISGESNLYLGRTEHDAPEVDGQVYLKGKTGNLQPGFIVDSKVIDTHEYNLVVEQF